MPRLHRPSISTRIFFAHSSVVHPGLCRVPHRGASRPTGYSRLERSTLSLPLCQQHAGGLVSRVNTPHLHRALHQARMARAASRPQSIRMHPAVGLQGHLLRSPTTRSPKAFTPDLLGTLLSHQPERKGIPITNRAFASSQKGSRRRRLQDCLPCSSRLFLAGIESDYQPHRLPQRLLRHCFLGSNMALSFTEHSTTNIVRQNVYCQ